MAQIKVISFDGDDTLWDFQMVMRHALGFALKAIANKDPLAATLLTIDKMIATRNRVAENLKGKITNLEQIRLEAFKQTLKDIKRPNDELAADLNQIYLKHRFEDIKLYDDVLPTLKTLQLKYKLGLISNGNSYPEKCGLEEIFEFIVFSQDHGVEKPDPGLFYIALEKACCLPEQMLYVGDSLVNDVDGATKAGLPCVWLNRKNKENSLGIETRFKITSLLELPGIIQQLAT